MTTSPEELRSKQREQWNMASHGWITRREEVSRPTQLITKYIVELSRPAQGHRVLDLACGVGDPAFTLADIVGQTGCVLGLDISEAMIEGARAWATENKVLNIKFEAINSELTLGVADESFDLCTCRHGLMFMPDPQLAMKSMSTAVRSGGRITVSTWGLPENSPAFTLPGQIIGRHANLPAPDGKGPGLFSLSTPEIHANLFRSIGFHQVETRKFDCPVMVAESPQAMWEQVSTMGGPMVKVISDLDPSIRELVQKDFLETLSSKFGNNKVILTGEALVTTGTKPLI